MDAASIVLVIAVLGVGITSTSNAASPQDTSQVSRSSGPVQHTANFAGQSSGWSSDANAAADRYGNAVQATITQTGNSLRDGVEAGIQDANRQLSQNVSQGISQGADQLMNSAHSAGQNAAQQFQGWAGTTTQQVQSSVPNPFATNSTAPTSTSRNGVSPPPGFGATAEQPSSSSNTSQPIARVPATPVVVTQVPGGWTTVNSGLAPPPMQVPRLVNTAEAPATVSLPSPPVTTMAAASGPGFPSVMPSNQPVEQSLLAPPANQQIGPLPGANEDVSIGWSGSGSQPSQATIGNGRYNSSASIAQNDMRQPSLPTEVTVRSQPPSSADIDAWSKADIFSNESGSANASNSQLLANNGNNPSQPPANYTAGQLASMNSMNQQPANPGQNMLVQGNADSERLPWMPLVFATVALAGSIGANLFLGWSYMDARQRYRHLVQKTANKFRRASAA